MTRLTLVRHGHAAAGWGEDADPGLDAAGRAEADAMARALGPLGPLPVVVSPLRRTRETAAPLERQWAVEARVEPGVGEIVSPTADLAARRSWLREVMAGRWSDVDDAVHDWRRRVIDTLAAIGEDTVVVTHFVAINVVAGWATGDDRVMCFAPGYCSWTVVDVADGRFSVVELGAQADTRVL